MYYNYIYFNLSFAYPQQLESSLTSLPTITLQTFLIYENYALINLGSEHLYRVRFTLGKEDNAIWISLPYNS